MADNSHYTTGDAFSGNGGDALIKTELTFEFLVAQCRNELAAAAYHLCGDRDAAQDIVQETLMDAYKGFAGLRESDKAKSWLYAILRRKAINHRRSRKPHVELQDDIPAPNSDTTEALVRDIIVGQISRLPEQDREVLAGKYLLGLSYSELAESLGCKESAARVRCFRAKERLREILKSTGLNVPDKRVNAEGDQDGM